MNALNNISYGLFILTAKGENYNGCIINTLIQVTSNPQQVSITINKENLTTSIIEKTGVFNVSILDTNTKFDLIKRFGFQSGKTINKFDGFNNFDIAENGVPYITENTNAYISARVVSKIDVGTHITFVAEVTKDCVLNNNQSLTYAYYQANIKPQKITEQKGVYVCRICGYVHDSEVLPTNFICPICKHGVEAFDRVNVQTNKQNATQKKQKSNKGSVFCAICGSPNKEGQSSCSVCGQPL